MARFTVFSQDGTQARYTGTPVYHGTFLKPAYIEFREIASPTLIQWQIGDYVDYQRTGFRYKLYSVPYPTKQAVRNAAGDAFVYRDVQFFCATKDLEIAPFRDLVISDNTIHFTTLPDVSTYEDVFGIARRIQANMDAFYGEGVWKIKVYDTSDTELRDLLQETKEFSVSNGNCLDALSQIYSAWKGIGWIYSVDNGVNTITIGRPNIQDSDNTTSVFAYGIGNGLKVIKKEQSGKNELATRLYAYGSTRNLIARYYNNLTPPIKDAQSVYIPNLMIPLEHWGETSGQKDARKAHIDADAATVAKYGLRPKTVYFDGSGEYEDIYPSIEGMTIGEIRAAMDATEEYRPAIADDSDRVDEIVDAINPTDGGITSEGDGKKYAQVLNLNGISKRVSSQLPPGQTSAIISLGALTLTGTLSSTGRMLVTPEVNGTIESTTQLGGLSMSVWLEIEGKKYGEKQVAILDEGSNRYSISIEPFTLTIRNTGSISLKGSILFSPTNLSDGIEVNADIAVGTCMIEVETTVRDVFEITVRQLGFDISKQQSAISDGLCTVSFKTGWCAGREFTVKKCEYVATQDEWRLTVIRKYDESIGQYFPNNVYVISPGDRFVLTDLTMPEIYVRAAQHRLYNRAKAVLDGLSVPHIVYEPEIDAKVLAKSPEKILEGMYMHLTDTDIIDGVVDWIIIDTIEIDEGAEEIPTYRITLQDEKREGFLSLITRESGRNTRAINDIITTAHRRDVEGEPSDVPPLSLPVVRIITSSPIIAYDGGVPANNVLLTCETQNISTPEYQWFFYNPSTATWVVIPGATEQTYAVDPASGLYFLDGRLVEEFRIVINGENQLSASVQVAKMITGDQTVYRLDLTNENASINADAEWNILPDAVRPTCTAKLYYGATEMSGVTYSISTSARGVSIDSSTGVLTFDSNFNFSGTGVEIAVIASKEGVTAIAIMTVTKVVPGADGADAVSYWLVLSADKVSVDPNAPTISPQPDSVAATAMKQVGSSTPVEASECTIRYKFDDGLESVYQAPVPIDIDKDSLHFILYLGTTVVDTESVPILYNGINGEDGVSVVAQYSADGATDWHATFAAGDLYMRTSADGGQTWGAAIRIVGEEGAPGSDGKPGDYTDYSFAYSPNLTSSQADGCPTDTGTDGSEGSKIAIWNDAPPTAVAGQYLWMRVIGMTYDPENPSADAEGFVHGTPSYARIGGENGKDGDNGKRGKIMRGPTIWQSTGYCNTGEYQGSDDATGDFVDVAQDPKDQLFYRCKYKINPLTSITAISARPALNIADAQTGGCWDLLNNYDNIATRALIADEALISQAQIEKLDVKRLTSEVDAEGKTEITGGKINVSQTDGTLKVNIHGGQMRDTGAGTSITRTIQAASGSTEPSDTQLEFALIPRDNTQTKITIVNSNNGFTTPALTLSLSSAIIIPTVSVTLMFESGTSAKFVYGYETNVKNTSCSINIPSIKGSLGEGEWGLYLYVGIASYEGQAVTANVAAPASPLVVNIQSADALTEIASDGMRSIWNGEGIKVSSEGAKLIQAGREYNTLGGGAIQSTLTAPKKILVCTAYPPDNQLEADALYFKVASS